MKISQMNQREDFYSILQDTVNEYYPEGKFSIEKNSGITYYSLEKLNTVINSSMTADAKRFIKDEFSYINPLKNRLSSIYVDIAFAAPRLISSRRFFWDNAPEHSNHILIYPSNRKIRFMDFKTMKTHVHMKYGFQNTMMLRETAFRSMNSNFPFVLPVYNVSERSYKERIMHGRSAARCRSIKRIAQASKEALECMKLLQSGEESHSINAQTYAKQLSQNICRRLNGLKYKDLTDLATYAADATEEENITIALTHGDLQIGNIWLEDGNTVILDWESVGMRVNYFDEAVLYSGVRNSNDYAMSLADIMKIVYNRQSSINMKNIGRIFLLEDILWFIDEQEAMNSIYESYGMMKLKRREVIEHIKALL